MAETADFIVVGAGSAGCVVAAELVRRETGSVLLIEAGPSNRHPLVSMPFGLVWLIGGGRDWRFRTAPQAAMNNRAIAVPRGRMVGGSGSINSMVWFRGRAEDFDTWQLPGWAWEDVEPAFEAVEAHLRPATFDGAHPIIRDLSGLFGANAPAAPSPERESSGVFRFNMSHGRRRSAADAFLAPLEENATLRILTGREVRRIALKGDRASRVEFKDGTGVDALKGIVLSAGAIGSPAILLASGIGPAEDLRAAGKTVCFDAEGVGRNLHDHPAVGLHFTGTGYGLTAGQAVSWAVAPFRYALSGTGRLASPTVEGGLFFSARGESALPDVQSHVIPFMMGWKGRRFVYGSGFFADVCLCRPRSRGALRLGQDGLVIDPGLLSDLADLNDLVAGVRRLRRLLAEAGLLDAAKERFPGPAVTSVRAVADHIRTHGGTAYHPVGTLSMGDDWQPVAPDLSFKGVRGLWVADASVLPRITSANTNAPSMMIGYRAARLIAEAAA